MSNRDRSINLADETWGQLTEIARSQDRSVSWLVRQAIEQYLYRDGVVSGVWSPSALVSPEDVEAAKPYLESALNEGRTKADVGATTWTFSPFKSASAR